MLTNMTDSWRADADSLLQLNTNCFQDAPTRHCVTDQNKQVAALCSSKPRMRPPSCLSLHMSMSSLIKSENGPLSHFLVTDRLLTDTKLSADSDADWWETCEGANTHTDFNFLLFFH